MENKMKKIEIDEKAGGYQPKVKSSSKYKSIGETTELSKEMQAERKKYQQMFGLEGLMMWDEMQKQEQVLFQYRDKFKLQAKVKQATPMCDNCSFYQIDFNNPNKKHCDPHKEDRCITYGRGEAQNPDFAIEICKKFDWKKGL